MLQIILNVCQNELLQAAADVIMEQIMYELRKKSCYFQLLLMKHMMFPRLSSFPYASDTYNQKVIVQESDSLASLTVLNWMPLP